jgi:LysM repeat protein
MTIRVPIHTVVRGDSLASIAERYTGTASAWTDLLDVNRALGDGGDLHVGDRIRLPLTWRGAHAETAPLLGTGRRVGLGDAPLANGLPDSSDIIQEGVQAGVDWVAQALGLSSTSSAVEAATLLANVPVEAIAGYFAGVVAADAVAVTSTGVLGVLSSVAPAAAVALSGAADVAVAAAAAALPVAGAAIAAVAAIAEIIEAIEGPPQITTEGYCGGSATPQPCTLDVAFYASTAVPTAIHDAPKYLTMDPAAFAVQETISADDLVLTNDANPVFVSWTVSNLYGGQSSLAVVPGADSILHAAQLSAASAAAASAANVLPLYTSQTGPALLPLVTADEWTDIYDAVAPMYWAIVNKAQAWANAQPACPTDADLETHFALVESDREKILAACAKAPHKAAAPATSTAATVVGGVAAVGALGTAVALGLAAYRGVSVASVASDWWNAARGAARKVFR